VSVADHAADAAAVLDHLGLRPVHIAGHSSGAAVAAQVALDHPEYVHTLMLLEPSLISVPSLEALFKQVEPAFEAYASGDHAGALAIFMNAVSGLESTRAAALLEERFPGAVAQAIRDADTFFGVELPALTEWTFGAEEAARLNRPVLSVVGGETQPVWVETAEFLRSSLPHAKEARIKSVGHLLHIQRSEPVAQAMANFLTRNSSTETTPGDFASTTRRTHSSPPRLNARRANPTTRRNHAAHQRQAHRGRLHALPEARDCRAPHRRDGFRSKARTCAL